MELKDSFFEWIKNVLSLTSKKKKLVLVRSKWAQDVDIWRDPDLVSIYHQHNRKKEIEYVDNKTWNNLKMWDVFQKLDRTVSTAGRQVLFDRLKTYQTEKVINTDFYNLVELFKKDKNLREQIQLQLMKLETSQSYFLPIILTEGKGEKIAFPFIYHAMGYLAYILPLIIFIKPVFLFVLIGLAMLNISINFYFTKKIYSNFSIYYYLSVMANITLTLSKKVDLPSHPLFDFIKSSRNLCKKIKRRMGNLLTDRSALSEAEQTIYEYMNMIGLYDFRIFLKANELIKNHNYELKKIFRTLGEIDAIISTASYLEQNKECCKPVFNNYNSIKIENLVHPLLENAVANSINLETHSLLITGSNMSGKTTFLKTIGVNFILAQTIGFVRGTKAFIPRLQVLSSIKIQDDLTKGKSYYQTEVDEILEFLKKENNISKYIFLIDEIYQGTNTIERISASAAVLKHLSMSNITFVTTHDIELQNLLSTGYKMKHFSECVDGGKFYFDYKIKDGPCKTRNAIKLLELSGYPVQVVTNAYELAENFTC